MREVVIEHLASGARRSCPVSGLDGHRKLVLVGFGLCGVYEFSLSTGRGRKPAEYWSIVDLDAVRDDAQRYGMKLPPRRSAPAPHHRALRPRTQAAAKPPPARQLTLDSSRSARRTSDV